MSSRCFHVTQCCWRIYGSQLSVSLHTLPAAQEVMLCCLHSIIRLWFVHALLTFWFLLYAADFRRYEALMDPEKRRRYDQQLLAARSQVTDARYHQARLHPSPHVHVHLRRDKFLSVCRLTEPMNMAQTAIVTIAGIIAAMPVIIPITVRSMIAAQSSSRSQYDQSDNFPCFWMGVSDLCSKVNFITVPKLMTAIHHCTCAH